MVKILTNLKVMVCWSTCKGNCGKACGKDCGEDLDSPFPVFEIGWLDRDCEFTIFCPGSATDRYVRRVGRPRHERAVKLHEQAVAVAAMILAKMLENVLTSKLKSEYRIKKYIAAAKF